MPMRTTLLNVIEDGSKNGFGDGVLHRKGMEFGDRSHISYGVPLNQIRCGLEDAVDCTAGFAFSTVRCCCLYLLLHRRNTL